MSMDITCCLSGRAYSPKRCSFAERAVPALIYVKRASIRNGIPPCLIAASSARGVIDASGAWLNGCHVRVSRRARQPRAARKVAVGFGARPSSRVSRASWAIDIRHLQAHRAQPFPHGAGETLHQLVTEIVIGLAFVAQASGVNPEHPHEFR